MTSTGKGRLAGMAILDSEIQRALDEPMPQAVPPSDRRRDVSDHTVALTRVRRHGLSRLLLADVSGLALAAFLGPLLVSAVSSNPASAASRSGRIYLFDLAAIPMFVGVFALYGLYRGVTRRISMSVFSDLRNIVHAVMISGFALRHRGLRHAEERRSRRPDRREGSGHVPGGRHRRSAGPGGGLRVVQGGVDTGHRGGHRKAGPDRGQPPAGSFERELRRIRGRQSSRAQRRARRARGPPRAVPSVFGGPGGGVLLPNPSRAYDRDAEGPGGTGRRVDRSAVLRADDQPLPCGGPVGAADAGYRSGLAEPRIPVPQAVLRHPVVVGHPPPGRALLRWPWP